MTQITNDMLTDWFPVEISPVRAGWYDVKYSMTHDDSRAHRYFFDGVEWTMPLSDGSRVRCAYGNNVSTVQEVWRGVTEEANFLLNWPWPKK